MSAVATHSQEAEYLQESFEDDFDSELSSLQTPEKSDDGSLHAETNVLHKQPAPAEKHAEYPAASSEGSDASSTGDKPSLLHARENDAAYSTSDDESRPSTSASGSTTRRQAVASGADATRADQVISPGYTKHSRRSNKSLKKKQAAPRSRYQQPVPASEGRRSVDSRDMSASVPPAKIPTTTRELEAMLEANESLRLKIYAAQRAQYQATASSTTNTAAGAAQEKNVSRKEASALRVKETVLMHRMLQLLRVERQDLRRRRDRLAEAVAKYQRATRYADYVAEAKDDIVALTDEHRDLMLEVRYNEKLLVMHDAAVESGENERRLHEEIRATNALARRKAEHALRDADEAERLRDSLRIEVEALREQRDTHAKKNRSDPSMNRNTLHDLRRRDQQRQQSIDAMREQLRTLRRERPSASRLSHDATASFSLEDEDVVRWQQHAASGAGDTEMDYLKERISFMKAELARLSTQRERRASDPLKPDVRSASEVSSHGSVGLLPEHEWPRRASDEIPALDVASAPVVTVEGSSVGSPSERRTSQPFAAGGDDLIAPSELSDDEPEVLRSERTTSAASLHEAHDNSNSTHDVHDGSVAPVAFGADLSRGGNEDRLDDVLAAGEAGDVPKAPENVPAPHGDTKALEAAEEVPFELAPSSSEKAASADAAEVNAVVPPAAELVDGVEPQGGLEQLEPSSNAPQPSPPATNDNDEPDWLKF